MARETCTRCRRPESGCLCAAIVSVPNRTRVTIVQHMRERHHAFNTARIAQLALERCEVLVAWNGHIDDPGLPLGAALLYPGPGAVDLASLPVAERPTHLVVLDGTWPHAKGLYRRHAWLRALRPVSLTPAAPSAYSIRREPAEHCLSTVESLACALALTEPENTAIPDLLRGFVALMATQEGGDGASEGTPRRAHRNRVPLTQQLRDHADRVVVVYAETAPPRGRAGDADLDVLQLAAVRPSTGAVFDHLAAVRAAPDACQLEHMGLDAADVSRAPPAQALRDAWEAFVRPDDLLVAWSWAPAEAALQALGEGRRAIRLKDVYRNVRRDGPGRLDAVVIAEALSSSELPVRGRAGQRLANASALCGWLAEQADPSS